MTKEQLKRMAELKHRVWVHHTWHINLAIGIERAVQAARSREITERIRWAEREKFEAEKPKLDALISQMKADRQARMNPEWTDAQLQARAVARDCLLDGRFMEAISVLSEHQMALQDMVARQATEWVKE